MGSEFPFGGPQLVPPAPHAGVLVRRRSGLLGRGLLGRGNARGGERRSWSSSLFAFQLGNTFLKLLDALEQQLHLLRWIGRRRALSPCRSRREDQHCNDQQWPVHTFLPLPEFGLEPGLRKLPL